MNIAPIQLAIQALDEHLTLLNSDKQMLVEKHEWLNASRQEFNDLIGAGREVRPEVFAGLQLRTQEYNQHLRQAVATLGTAAGAYQSVSDVARSFAVHVVADDVSHLARTVDDPNVEDVVQALVTLSDRMADLKADLEAYLAQQTRVEALLAQVAGQLSPELTALRADVNVAGALHAVQQRIENPLIPRERLLEELEQLRQTWEAKKRELLTADILGNYDRIADEMQWLHALSVLEPRHRAFYDTLDPDEFEPSMELLAQSFEALALCRQDAATGLEQLNSAISDTIQAAYTLLERIHEAMPETGALRGLVMERAATPERELPGYYRRLAAALDEARQAGTSGVDNYRDLIRQQPDYAFADPDELNQIGAALLAVADNPKEYAGPLWETGEDVLVRAFAGEAFNVAGFYGEFGYPVIARALAAAAGQGEIVRCLGFLNHYLPDEPQPETSLLAHDDVRRVLVEAAAARELWLSPEHAVTLDDGGLRAALAFLRHAGEEALPSRVRLQWLAVLHGALPEEAKARADVERMLAEALAETEQWLLLYYALQSLGARQPELWRSPQFRVMLCPLIGRALSQGEDGQVLLEELALSEQVQQLAGNDPGCHFLLAALRHRLAVDSGDPAMSNRAWQAWNEALPDGSHLRNLLDRELAGTQFDAVLWADAGEVARRYEELMVPLRDRVNTVPKLRQVKTAIAIYRWYQDTYWFEWLAELERGEELTARHTRALLKKIRAVARERDLVDFSPANRKPPPGSEMTNELDGKLAVQLNNTLRDVLDSFEEAVQLRQTLITLLKEKLPPMRDLQAEVMTLSDDGLRAWAIARLLSPTLAFLIRAGERTSEDDHGQ